MPVKKTEREQSMNTNLTTSLGTGADQTKRRLM